MILRSDNDQRGDTIIEVLIAVAIVSLVLTSAFALTNRNAARIQETQEQTYAQKLVQQQVELLRAMPATVTGVGCFDTSGVYTTVPSACNREPYSGGAVYKLEINNDNTPIFRIQASWDTLGGTNTKVTVYYEVAS